MPTPPNSRALARCLCGKVELEAQGEPIMSTVCYCESCQEGSRRMEALPNGHPSSGPDGGTPYVIYRKDRVRKTRGSEFLRDLRLEDKSQTRRVVAECCGSPMFLDFEKGHWLSVYQSVLQGDAPPVEMRTQTRSKPEGVELSDDVPSYPSYPLRFVTKLLRARVAMLFGR
jgi:hypothetical protein